MQEESPRLWILPDRIYAISPVAEVKQTLPECFILFRQFINGVVFRFGQHFLMISSGSSFVIVVFIKETSCAYCRLDIEPHTQHRG